ncbi:host specificity protein [Bradyrhizobium sp. CCGUVB23]|uniref:host specificity protein n=1 Tax=Bradyrhizobium sp. CCGUVB23 TaxID=2949630 RepID=UPI0020B31117|nr:host specificity protein [Bradyrhizobium sp. CCGUVB23]MCP3468043.1 host specificity protein [Bradyrhizobium sp. CCGUVB23]
MYGRIVGASDQSTSASHADEWGEEGESSRFSEAVAGMEPGESSSTTRYTLASNPPVIEIDRSSFMEGVRRYLGSDIRHIAANPQEYSNFVSEKAERAAMVAGGYTSTYDDPNIKAKFYSYQLGDESVGLLRAGGAATIKGERFLRRYGRNDITSVVDLRITHPQVANAGDILLEHQLRMDGDYPLVLSRPALEGMEPRLTEMGFDHFGRNYWVLDPHEHPEVWTKNDNDQWQRVDKPTKYLSNADGNDTGRFETASSDDDPAFYLERYMAGLSMEHSDSE